MMQVLGGVSAGQWDAWRDDPLTKRCIAMLREHVQKKYGSIADDEMRRDFPALFADPARQARYAELRGRIQGVNDLADALGLGLSELFDLKDERGDFEKDQPR